MVAVLTGGSNIKEVCFDVEKRRGSEGAEAGARPRCSGGVHPITAGTGC